MEIQKIIKFFLIYSNFVLSNIHIWEPKSLRSIYQNRKFPYNIVNFGNVPYGHSVYGTLFKADPFDACEELKPIPYHKNYGTLIVIVQRNGCHFSEKVLNAQKIGAGFVIIEDSHNKNLGNILPIERTKKIIDQIKIPSVLIQKNDSEILLESISQSQQDQNNNVELAIFFAMTKTYKKSLLKFVVAVDDPRSYELIDQFRIYYRIFEGSMNFDLTFKLFNKEEIKKAKTELDDCVGDNKQYCAIKSFEDHLDISGLAKETLRQMCIKNENMEDYFEYAKNIKLQCFENERIKVNFTQCADKQFKKFSQSTQQLVNECASLNTTMSMDALRNNHERISHLLINYQPLIFINGFYYKGNFDNVSHLMESFCNSFEVPPKQCFNLDAFIQSDDLNSTNLIHFILISCLICVGCTIVALIIFYILTKKKIQRRFTFALNDKINQALAQYYGDDTESESQDFEVVENQKQYNQIYQIKLNIMIQKNFQYFSFKYFF